MMTTERTPTDFELALHRAIATSKTQPINARHVATQWLLEKSPHEGDHTMARAVLADLETIGKIEVI